MTSGLLLRVKAALRQVGGKLLKSHALHCVDGVISRGDVREQTRKFTELVELFGRYGK